jgi:hypothetical protein
MRAAGGDRGSFNYHKGTIIRPAMIQRLLSADGKREKPLLA